MNILNKIVVYTKKTIITIKNEGISAVFKKAKDKVRRRIAKDYVKYDFKDILFINGTMLPHPQRYRVDHQIEQLEAFGISCDRVDYDKVDLYKVKYYRGFVFYRCPITIEIREFIKRAKQLNKVTFFDVDDLVIDTKYTDQIDFVCNMSEADKNLYDDGVKRMKETMSLCEYGITTTSGLWKEMSKYSLKEVYINRNVASERMLALSNKANKEKENDESKFIMGYFSGSITHNDDFELIKQGIIDIMTKYTHVYLKLVGEVDLPPELMEFRERIIISPFISWKKLPSLIASVDLNLAPLEDTVFNRAKSENKWVEAALVKVPTLASNVGAFKEVISDGITGVLFRSPEEFCQRACEFIENREYGERIAFEAHRYVRENYITTYTGKGISSFIKSKLRNNIAFVVPTTNVSGGLNVIIKHASIMSSRGWDVTLISQDRNEEDVIGETGRGLPVLIDEYTRMCGFQRLIVGTLWSTVNRVQKAGNVGKRIYLVQGFETDFAKDGNYMKVLANATYCIESDLNYFTISNWCKEWLLEKFDVKAKYIPNGLNTSFFEFYERDFSKKIRILIEGNCEDEKKGIDESFKISNLLDREHYEIVYLSYGDKVKEWYRFDEKLQKVPYDQVSKVYQSCHILLKSSELESFSYPPLEMMSTGGVCVVLPNEGNQEYLVGGENCLFYERGQYQSAINLIETVRTNKELRDKLIKNGIETASGRAWELLEHKVFSAYENILKE